MNENESKYLDLAAELIEEIDNVHANSKKYIKRTFIGMAIMPVLIVIVIALVGVSKIAALFFWLAFMFAAGAYLIFLEYTDTMLKRKVESFIGDEDDMAEIQARIAEHKAAREAAEEAERLEREAIEEAEADAADAEEAAAKNKNAAKTKKAD